jgi:hypothetical protein
VSNEVIVEKETEQSSTLIEGPLNKEELKYNENIEQVILKPEDVETIELENINGSVEEELKAHEPAVPVQEGGEAAAVDDASQIMVEA